jgi:hypothetical protein
MGYTNVSQESSSSPNLFAVEGSKGLKVVYQVTGQASSRSKKLSRAESDLFGGDWEGDLTPMDGGSWFPSLGKSLMCRFD